MLTTSLRGSSRASTLATSLPEWPRHRVLTEGPKTHHPTPILQDGASTGAEPQPRPTFEQLSQITLMMS